MSTACRHTWRGFVGRREGPPIDAISGGKEMAAFGHEQLVKVV
jgi:hypothetical protein